MFIREGIYFNPFGIWITRTNFNEAKEIYKLKKKHAKLFEVLISDLQLGKKNLLVNVYIQTRYF